MPGKKSEDIRAIRLALTSAGLAKVNYDVIQKCALYSEYFATTEELYVQLLLTTSLSVIGASLALTLQVSPTQIAECWEAYSINKNLKLFLEKWQVNKFDIPFAPDFRSALTLHIPFQQDRAA